MSMKNVVNGILDKHEECEAKKELASKILHGALRQYCHNNGEGFLPGYDKKETDKIVSNLLAISWIAVKEQLPPHGRKVLGFYKNSLGNNRIILVERYTHLSVECNCEFDCYCDYDEKRDEYYLPAGWYEIAENHDEFGVMLVNDKITHWSPLPQCPVGV